MRKNINVLGTLIRSNSKNWAPVVVNICYGCFDVL